jgi:hypothetical protein
VRCRKQSITAERAEGSTAPRTRTVPLVNRISIVLYDGRVGCSGNVGDALTIFDGYIGVNTGSNFTGAGISDTRSRTVSMIQRRTKFAFTPCANVIAATETPGCKHRRTN